MCTFTEDIRPFHSDRQQLVAMRATLIDAGIVDDLAFITPIDEHDGEYSTPIRTICPYRPKTGGACLEQALSAIFPNRPPNRNCAYRQLVERTSNKASF